jgi:hypothetical protein
MLVSCFLKRKSPRLVLKLDEVSVSIKDYVIANNKILRIIY